MNICCTDTPVLQSIDCITLNCKLPCSLYVCISSLRYPSLKCRSTFDYCRDMARPIKSCLHLPCSGIAPCCSQGKDSQAVMFCPDAMSGSKLN